MPSGEKPTLQPREVWLTGGGGPAEASLWALTEARVLFQDGELHPGMPPLPCFSRLTPAPGSPSLLSLDTQACCAWAGPFVGRLPGISTPHFPDGDAQGSSPVGETQR